MIQPADIRRKAENLYRPFLQAWLAGDTSFFPRAMPARLVAGPDVSKAVSLVNALRDSSKAVVGYGYSVEWQEINSRRLGRNLFPVRITFETQDDFLRFVGRVREFDHFRNIVSAIRTRHPCLGDWVRSNVADLIEHGGDVQGMLEVVDVFLQVPRPGCFARELPISVDTKFIERHETLLKQWLDRVLPPHAIRADEDHFERRYGLRYAEPQLLVRFLDTAVQKHVGFPCEIVSIPLHTIGTWVVTDVDVVMVENKVNLFTIPRRKRGIGLGSLGNAVSLLRYLPWLQRATITYWGDVDVEGLSILSAVRAVFPHTHSVMMGADTLQEWRHLAVSGTGRSLATPAHLVNEELSAFKLCSESNLRLEQERIPQSAVLEAFAACIHRLTPRD